MGIASISPRRTLSWLRWTRAPAICCGSRRSPRPKIGYLVAGAPLVLKGKIITGIAPGDYGMNGFLDAYDSTTGERLWRWNAIPRPGEPGQETWAGDSWKTGGGDTWLTGSYDPELNLIYWGIGNPAPDFNGEMRKGDNLYTECMVALDADTGS